MRRFHIRTFGCQMNEHDSGRLAELLQEACGLEPAQDPAQAEVLVETLRGRGVPVDYVTFPGEGHGFRRAETIADVLAREEAFLARTLGLGRVA